MKKMTNGEKMVWAAVFAKSYCDLAVPEAAFARFSANKAVLDLREIVKRSKVNDLMETEMLCQMLED